MTVTIGTARGNTVMVLGYQLTESGLGPHSISKTFEADQMSEGLCSDFIFTFTYFYFMHQKLFNEGENSPW